MISRPILPDSPPPIVSPAQRIHDLLLFCNNMYFQMPRMVEMVSRTSMACQMSTA